MFIKYIAFPHAHTLNVCPNVYPLLHDVKDSLPCHMAGENGYRSCQNHNAEHICVGLLHVSPHVAYMGHSDLIGGVRHQGTSLKCI